MQIKLSCLHGYIMKSVKVANRKKDNITVHHPQLLCVSSSPLFRFGSIAWKVSQVRYRSDIRVIIDCIFRFKFVKKFAIV